MHFCALRQNTQQNGVRSAIRECLSTPSKLGVHAAGKNAGHSRDFIDQAWSQRLHGRQPSEPAKHAQHAQRAQRPQQAQHAQQSRHAQQAQQAAADKSSKQPLQFPEDINSLLPPEWGGKAAETSKAKPKGKQKSKLSLTAQYLHPETAQPSSHGVQYDRNRQPANRNNSSTNAQLQKNDRGSNPLPGIAQHAQGDSSETSQAKLGNAHSFGDWMQDGAEVKQPLSGLAQGRAVAASGAPPPWFQPQSQPQQSPPLAPAQSQYTFRSSSSAYPEGIPRPTSAGDALPWNSALPARPHTRSEERLGQLTALHHKGNASESSAAGLGQPRSRSPSPMLLEDDDLDAELGPVQPRYQVVAQYVTNKYHTKFKRRQTIN